MHFTIVGRSVAPGLMSFAVAARTRRRAFGASRAGARHDGSARDRRAGTALSGPGVARCVASVRRFRRGNEEKLFYVQQS
jgi:hypothetical protein